MPALPSVSIVYTELTDRSLVRVYNRWFERGKWDRQLLFTRTYREPLLDGGIIYSRYSPNCRYYYEAAHQVYQSNDTRLWVAGQQGERDSRRFWYGSGKGWYRLPTDNLRGRPERISKPEYERLFRDWDLLNPRFRTDWATLEEREVFYSYSLHGGARARAYPSVPASAPQLAVWRDTRRWRPQVVEVQRRDGKRYRVVSNRDERVCLRVSAVSDDGRWVLVAFHRWDENAQREATAWQLYEAARRRLVQTWTEGEIPLTVELIELGAGKLTSRNG